MSSLNKRDIDELARLFKSGDSSAAERIFNYFAPKVFSYVFARIGQREEAEDLTQDVFLKLVRHIDDFDSETASFPAWFWQIVKNRLIDYYRGRKKREAPFNNLEFEIESISDRGKNIHERLADKLDIEKFMETLNEEEKEIFTMRLISGLPYREIAEALNKPESTLRVAVNRMKKKLKENFYHE